MIEPCGASDLCASPSEPRNTQRPSCVLSLDDDINPFELSFDQIYSHHRPYRSTITAFIPFSIRHIVLYGGQPNHELTTL